MARDETNGCTGTGEPALTYTITDKGVLTVSGTPSAIGESAFRGRDELTDVRLPDSVVRIEDHAFADCRNLKWVEPGRDCRSIGDGAFRGCGELFSVDWEESRVGSIACRTRRRRGFRCSRSGTLPSPSRTALRIRGMLRRRWICRTCPARPISGSRSQRRRGPLS